MHNYNEILYDFRAERMAMLEQSIRETDETYSMAKSFQNMQTNEPRYSSSYSSLANKRPSPQGEREGHSRLLYEYYIKNFENKVIRNVQSKISDEKLRKSYECVFNRGDYITRGELRTVIQNSKCQLPNPKCQRQQPEFRTIDGSCNNMETQTQGMADMPFRRLLPAQYDDGMEIPKGRLQAVGCLDDFCLGPLDPPVPSARLVSRKIVLNNEDTEAPISHILMQWGQFLDHDLGLAPEMMPEEEGPCNTCAIEDECEPIQIEEDDPVFGGGKGTTKDGKCLTFRRSIAVCTKNPTVTPREQLNDLTSYLDGSQIYGSSDEIANRLIDSKDKSLMATSVVNGETLLPTSSEEGDCLMQEKCFITGDVRANEQVGLTTLHTLFVREHNRIARQLTQMNGKVWSAERIFQETRKIVGAMLQKITYEDYLPKVFGSTAFNIVMRKYTGYRPCVDASIPNSFAASAYRYGHSLVRPVFNRLLNDNYRLPGKPLSLRKSFFNMESFLETKIDAVLRGLVSDNALRNDEFMNSIMTTELFGSEESHGMDLAALNIQRSRDHGLPVYGSFKTYCQSLFPGLPSAQVARQETLWRLYEVYGSPEISDLFVGGLAEKKLPKSLLGPTFACLFGITFSDLRDGDRFYYENKDVFTPNQLREIRKASLSRIICDNTGINRIQRDAFRTDLNRMRCSNLPAVNLRQWRVAGSAVADDDFVTMYGDGDEAPTEPDDEMMEEEIVF